MSNNLYEKVIQWGSQADKISGVDGRLISSTYDETYGQDIDNEPIGDPTIINNENGPYIEKQRYDYDVLNTPRGGAQDFNEDWLNSINKTDNFNVTSRSRFTADQGGFLDEMGRSQRTSNTYEGTWNQQEIMDINEGTMNGRVHDASDVVVNQYMGSMTGNEVVNKDNQITSVKGLVESTALSEYFFSDMNKDLLQDAIKARVWKNTDQVIGKQSDNELYIIMRSIMLQFANLTVNGRDNLINEIQKLNMKVLDYCSEIVSSNVLQHNGYVSDLEKLPIPLSRGINPYDRNRGYGFDLSRRNA